MLSLVGSAWASSVCAPETGTSAPVQAAQHPVAPGDDCMPGPAGHGPEAPTKAPPCPFGTGGMTAACTAASLPATSAVPIAPSPEVALALITAEAEPHLLLGTRLFHPPKA